MTILTEIMVFGAVGAAGGAIAFAGVYSIVFGLDRLLKAGLLK